MTVYNTVYTFILLQKYENNICLLNNTNVISNQKLIVQKIPSRDQSMVTRTITMCRQTKLRNEKNNCDTKTTSNPTNTWNHNPTLRSPLPHHTKRPKNATSTKPQQTLTTPHSNGSTIAKTTLRQIKDWKIHHTSSRLCFTKLSLKSQIVQNPNATRNPCERTKHDQSRKQLDTRPISKATRHKLV